MRTAATIEGMKQRVRNLRYLKSYLCGQDLNRTQELTHSGYTLAWGKVLSSIKRNFEIPRLMVLDGKTVKATNFDLDPYFIRSHYTAIRNIMGKDEGPAKILEVGAGFGRFIFPLASLFPRYQFSGVEYTDVGPRVAQEYRERFAQEIKTLASAVGPIGEPQVESIISGDAKNLPFADKSFDISYTNLVLEQIPHPTDYQKAFAEMRRVTRRACCFLEPWDDAQTFFTKAYLVSTDYFRARAEELKSAGFGRISFQPLSFQHNLKFRMGYVVAEVDSSS